MISIVSGSHLVRTNLNTSHLEICGIVMVSGAPLVLAVRFSWTLAKLFYSTMFRIFQLSRSTAINQLLLPGAEYFLIYILQIHRFQLSVFDHHLSMTEPDFSYKGGQYFFLELKGAKKKF